VNSTPIDVWNVKTFDPSLMARLEPDAELVRNFIQTDNEIFGIDTLTSSGRNLYDIW
jgi:hypothetical protein